MTSMLGLSYFALLYASIGMVWLAWMWSMRTPREVAETDRIRRQYGWRGVAFLLFIGIVLWPMILFQSRR